MTHVLLVDDNDRQRKLSRAFLEDAGYVVDDAPSASIALSRARSRRPDVIVSDVIMDTVDGFGLCRRLQDDTLLASIPVVLVSAHYDDDSARSLARTLGASALIGRTPDFSAEIQGIVTCLAPRPERAPRRRRESYEAHLETNANQLTRLLEQTRRAELRWRSVFEHAHDTVTLLTPEGVILEANERWVQVSGIAPVDLVGHHFSEFAAPDARDQAIASFQTLFERGAVQVVVALRHANGSTVYVEFASRLIDVDGESCVLAIGRDMTEKLESERRAAAAEAERRKLEDRLAHAQRLETVGQLTGGIAHDFNNILCAILSNAEFLLGDLAAEDPRRGDAMEIHEAARRATELTRRLLAFSRRQVLELADVDLGAVVRSVSKMLRRLLGGGIKLEIAEPAGPAMVRADIVQLEQVIVNFAVNARDAMPDGGQLAIATAEVTVGEGAEIRPGSYIMLSVADTGCGMSEETQRRLFEPFFTTKDRAHGTGLGLSTSYGIVKQLGGEIVVTSELGRGTTMKVYLPRLEGDASALGTPRVRRPTSSRLPRL